MGRSYHDSDSRRYLDWMYYSYQDYESANVLLQQDSCYNCIAFHCQQCIEKSLKGYLLFKKHKLFDGHNLTWLCKQAMNCDEHFIQWLTQCTLLNKYYIETRYPADIPLEVDLKTVTSIIECTAELLDFITEQLRFDLNSYHKRKKS
jgi:HEPN domain-containing protein